MYTPVGETWYTRHLRFSRQFTYATHTLPVGSPRMWQPFVQSSTESNRSAALEKKGLPTTSPAHRLADLWVPTPFLSPSLIAIEVVGIKPNIRWQQAKSIYWAHISNMWSICSIRTCLKVPTHRALTNIDRGYNLRGVDFPHHSSRLSQPTVLRFPLRALPGLKLTMINIKLQQ
jgi:hypothetical protein